MINIGEKHCAATNPEAWKFFSEWFYSKHYEMPKGFWSENAVLAWQNFYDGQKND